jgi:hypothetical protein
MWFKAATNGDHCNKDSKRQVQSTRDVRVNTGTQETVIVTFNSYRISITRTNQLTLYREIIAVCSQIHTKHTNTHCGQNVGFLSLKTRGSLYSPIVINMLQIVTSVYGAERSPLPPHTHTHTHTQSTRLCCPVQTGAQRSGNPSFKEPNRTPLVLKQCNVVIFNFKALKIVEN